MFSLRLSKKQEAYTHWQQKQQQQYAQYLQTQTPEVAATPVTPWDVEKPSKKQKGGAGAKRAAPPAKKGKAAETAAVPPAKKGKAEETAEQDEKDKEEEKKGKGGETAAPSAAKKRKREEQAVEKETADIAASETAAASELVSAALSSAPPAHKKPKTRQEDVAPSEPDAAATASAAAAQQPAAASLWTQDLTPEERSALEEAARSKTAFVLNLPYEVDEDAIKDVFSLCGEVKEVRLARTKQGKSKGFAYVEFTSEDAVNMAIEAVNGTTMGDRKLTVERSKPPKPKQTGVDEYAIFVKGLPTKGKPTPEAILKELTTEFSKAGAIKEIRRPVDRAGLPKPFAYIEFVDKASVPNALLLDKITIGGRFKLRVQHSDTGAHAWDGVSREVRGGPKNQAGSVAGVRRSGASQLAFVPRSAALRGACKTRLWPGRGGYARPGFGPVAVDMQDQTSGRGGYARPDIRSRWICKTRLWPGRGGYARPDIRSRWICKTRHWPGRGGYARPGIDPVAVDIHDQALARSRWIFNQASARSRWIFNQALARSRWMCSVRAVLFTSARKHTANVPELTPDHAPYQSWRFTFQNFTYGDSAEMADMAGTATATSVRQKTSGAPDKTDAMEEEEDDEDVEDEEEAAGEAAQPELSNQDFRKLLMQKP
eukprot:g22739.t1